MTHTPFRRTRLALALGGVVIALGSGHAYGGGFALQETSGSGLGNAFAGGAAAAEDAGTVWSNPAGMSRIGSMQVVGAFHVITPSFEFNDNGSQAAAFQPLGHTGGDAGTVNFVPNAYFVAPINRQLALGLGLNGPFGLVTHYGEGWLGRFQGIESNIKTINVNPALSWKVNDRFAIGIGASYQRIDATLTSRANYSAALAQAAQQAAAGGLIPAAAVPGFIAATPGLDSGVKIDGDDSAWGWNVGLLFDLDQNSRIGLAYRSKIKYNVVGNASFDHPALPALPPALAPIGAALAPLVNATFFNGGVQGDLEVPDTANISYFRRINDKWDVMADAQWTGWSSFQTLKFVRTTGAVLGSNPENFDDVWRFSVGANYHQNERLMFRGGLAYDQGPANDTDRTPRLPDVDRVWFSIGAQYAVTPQLKLDGGFTYIVGTKKASIDQNGGSTAQNGLIKGNYDVSATIFSVQAAYSF